jgi:hypothetical protein
MRLKKKSLMTRDKKIERIKKRNTIEIHNISSHNDTTKTPQHLLFI